MKRHSLVLLWSVILLGLASCGAPASSEPTAAAPAETALAPTTVPTATIFVSSSGAGRRAPTLAPTEIATTAASATPLPSDTATPLPTATALPAATRTLPNASPTRPSASATPPLAPAVYVTALRVDPPAPKSKPAQFLFHAKFLNTVGENVNYPRWRVLIFPKGESKAVGDPQGASKTIANGVSEQTTEAWSIKVIGCVQYVAQPVWINEDGKPTPFPLPSGNNASLEFEVCP